MSARLDALDRQLLRLSAQRDGLNVEHGSWREHYEALRGEVLNVRVLRVVGSLGLDEVVRLLETPGGPAGDRAILAEAVDPRMLAGALSAREEMHRVRSLIEETNSEFAALSTLIQRCRQHIADTTRVA